MADTSEENEDVSDILILSDPEATASLATLSPSLKSSSASDEAFSRVPSRLYDVPVNIDNKPAEYEKQLRSVSKYQNDSGFSSLKEEQQAGKRWPTLNGVSDFINEPKLFVLKKELELLLSELTKKIISVISIIDKKISNINTEDTLQKIMEPLQSMKDNLELEILRKIETSFNDMYSDYLKRLNDESRTSVKHIDELNNTLKGVTYDLKIIKSSNIQHNESFKNVVININLLEKKLEELVSRKTNDTFLELKKYINDMFTRNDKIGATKVSIPYSQKYDSVMDDNSNFDMNPLNIKHENSLNDYNYESVNKVFYLMSEDGSGKSEIESQMLESNSINKPRKYLEKRNNILTSSKTPKKTTKSYKRNVKNTKSKNVKSKLALDKRPTIPRCSKKTINYSKQL